MRGMIFSLGLASALGFAAPAAAQTWGGYDPAPFPSRPPASDSGIARELGKNRDVIRAGRRSGQLTRSESRALRRERAMIRTLERRYARGGLSEFERAELQTRIEILRSNTAASRGN